MRKGDSMTAAVSHLLKIIGILSIFYLAVISLYCGFLPAFSWFWAGIGVCGILMGTLLQSGLLQNFQGIEVLCGIILGAVVILTVILLCSFAVLYSAGNKKPEKGADYLIVLGAKVKGKVPTKALKGRIQAAYEYLNDNPKTVAVLTGGQGKGEDISESSCMERELLSMGISKERLRKEEKSTTTLENIDYAKEWIPDTNGHIVVVTSDFHVKRGVAIAKEAGFIHAEGLGDKSVPIMSLHYYTREVLAWVKYGLHRLENGGEKTF